MFKCVCENFHSEQCTKNEVFRQEIFRKYEKIHRKNAGMLTFSKETLTETSIIILSFLTQIEQEISIYWMKEIEIRMTSLSNDKYFQSKI